MKNIVLKINLTIGFRDLGIHTFQVELDCKNEDEQKIKLQELLDFLDKFRDDRFSNLPGGKFEWIGNILILRAGCLIDFYHVGVQ